MLKSQRKNNQLLWLLYIATHTTQRNNSQQGKGINVNELTLDQHGTKEGTNMEKYRELEVMLQDINIVQ